MGFKSSAKKKKKNISHNHGCSPVILPDFKLSPSLISKSSEDLGCSEEDQSESDLELFDDVDDSRTFISDGASNVSGCAHTNQICSHDVRVGVHNTPTRPSHCSSPHISTAIKEASLCSSHVSGDSFESPMEDMLLRNRSLMVSESHSLSIASGSKFAANTFDKATFPVLVNSKADGKASGAGLFNNIVHPLNQSSVESYGPSLAGHKALNGDIIPDHVPSLGNDAVGNFDKVISDFPPLISNSVTSLTGNSQGTCSKSRLDASRVNPIISPNLHKTQPPVCAPNSSPWSSLFGSVTKNKGSLTFFTPSNINGKILVTPPAEVVKKGNEIWNDCLVGHFLDRKLPFSMVKSWAEKLWGKEGLVDVMSTNSGFFLFRFNNDTNCMRVLDSGPWFFAGKLLILQKWHEGLHLSKVKLSKVPIWVKFYNVPLNLWTNEGLSYVASAVGVPLYLDDATELRSRINYARVCVEISAENEIPKEFDLDLGKGKIISIDVEVPWKPPSCDICREFGHSVNRCQRVTTRMWVPKSTKNEQVESPVIIPSSQQDKDNNASSSKTISSSPKANEQPKDDCATLESSPLPQQKLNEPMVKDQSSEWTVVARKGGDKVILSHRMQKNASTKVPLDLSRKGIFVMPNSINSTTASSTSKMQNESSKFMESALASLKLKPGKSCIKDSTSRLPIRTSKITIKSPNPTAG